MSEWRPPPERTLADWSARCLADGEPTPLEQLEQARRDGDVWLAGRLERQIVRLAGRAVIVTDELDRLALVEIGTPESGVAMIDSASGRPPSTMEDRARNQAAFAEVVERFAAECRDWLKRPAYSRRAWDWLRDHETVGLMLVAVVCAIVVGILIGRA